MDWTVNEDLQWVAEAALDWAVKVVGVLVALVVAWLVAAAIKRRIIVVTEARNLDPTLSRFAANIARYTLLAAAVLSCLGVFGIQTASFAAVLAALGLAIGLALQGTLGNFASGAMLLIFRPFKVGDVINAAGVIGKVTELELFTTELTTADNRRLIIPNGKIFGDTIENITHHPTRRVEIPVGVSYSADLKQCREVLVKAAGAVEGVLTDPAPTAFLNDLGDSSINWKVRVWCNTADFWGVHEALVLAIKTALDGARIEIPFPQLDVHADRLP